MMGKRELGAAIREGHHRFLRIHVLVAHEPARLIGSDRQDGEAERAIALARLAEPYAVAIARIGHVIDAAGGRFDDEARP